MPVITDMLADINQHHSRELARVQAQLRECQERLLDLIGLAAEAKVYVGLAADRGESVAARELLTRMDKALP